MDAPEAQKLRDRVLKRSVAITVLDQNHPEAEFLDVIRTKVLKVFLLAIHSHLY